MLSNVKAFGLRLLAVWKKKIHNSEEGEKESRYILVVNRGSYAAVVLVEIFKDLFSSSSSRVHFLNQAIKP